MGLLYPKPVKKAGVQSNQPIIKKVLQQGGLHVCGVCRKGFPYLALAFECLTNCVAQMSKTVCVITVKSATGKISYQCPLCRRSYKDTPAADHCLRNCQKSSQKNFAQRQSEQETQNLKNTSSSDQIVSMNASQNIENLNQNISEKNKTKLGTSDTSKANSIVNSLSLREERRQKAEMFSRDGARYICRRCKGKYFTQEDVEACYTKPCTEPPKSVVDRKGREAAQEAEEKPKSAVQMASREEKEKYTRDGARYVCAECNKRFFTREDVISCFDSH